VSHKPTLDPSNNLDRLALDESARFSRHAYAIYTWMLHFYGNPVTSIPVLAGIRCCRLTNPLCCCVCSKTKSSVTINKDNCCNGHLTALIALSNLNESEIIHCHFGNTIIENPYTVLYDHKWRSVVISIRGTLSLEDCVTDALAESDSLAPAGRKYGFDGEGEYAHSGILRASLWILEDLERNSTLEKAFKEQPDYQVRGFFLHGASERGNV